MKTSLLLAAILSVLLIGYVSCGISTPTSFKLYIESSSSFAVQHGAQYVKFIVTDGTLNSSQTQLAAGMYNGILILNSSSSYKLAINFTVSRVLVDDVKITSGNVSTFLSATQHKVTWLILIEPIVPYVFILGMIGLGCMFGGPMYAVILIRKHEYQEAFIKFTIFFFLGLALFMAWVFA